MSLRTATPMIAVSLLLSAAFSTEPRDPASPVRAARSPFSTRVAEFRADPRTGDKWLETADGARFDRVADFLAAEARAVGEPLCRISPSLWDAVADPTRAGEWVEVSVLLREQPLAEIAERLRPALQADLAELRSRVTAAEARLAAALPPAAERARMPLARQMALEEAALTGEEREALDAANAAATARILEFREEALARAEPIAADLSARVLARFPEAVVTGRSAILNVFWIRLPAGRIPRLVLESPEVARVEAARTGRYALDVSVPAVGAANWWSGGYTGSGITVGIIDGGIDVFHPALSAAVSSSKTFHASAKSNTGYSDSATAVDDLDGHGTFVAGVVASRDSTYRGAGRAASILNARIFYKDSIGASVRANEADCADALRWVAGNAQIATMSVSFGSALPDGDGNISKLFDAAAQALSLPAVIATGNGGPDGPSLEYPADAVNVITVGYVDDADTTDFDDDSLASQSGRGPTSDGRRKPDLVAPGVDIVSTWYKWEGSAADFEAGSGSSLAAPLVAGGLALILQAKSTLPPEALKALLLGTTEEDSPYPSEPDDDQGYGGLDLAAAYAARSDVLTASFSLSGVRDYYYMRTASLSVGDRATLAWNRHLGSMPSSGFPGTPDPLLDLDLYLYDGLTGKLDDSSVSAVDPVEQVRATATVDAPVLRVYRRDDFPSSYGLEPFALATPSGFTTASVPALSVEISGVVDYVGPGETYDVTAKVKNSGDLNAATPSVTLGLPNGTTVVSGTNPRALATLKKGESASATWTIKTASTSVTDYVTATPTSTCYGSTFTCSPARAEQEVDATSPRGTIAVDGGARSTANRSVTLALSAWDPDSTVTEMRFSTDGSTFDSFTPYATTKSFTLPAGDGVKTVFVEFRDGEGNVSKKRTSDSIIYDTTPPSGSFSIESGNGWAKSTSVTLNLAVTDSGGAAASGWTHMRFRNAGSAWGGWIAAASTASFTLPAGEGQKTVEAEFRDDAGNVGATVSVTVGLDETPPSAAIPVITGASGWRSARLATIALDASDPGSVASGVEFVRFRNEAGAWSAFLPYAATIEWLLSAGNGAKTVSAEFRDRAGNVTAAGPSVEDVRLDEVPPTGSFVLNDGRPYSQDDEVSLRIQSPSDVGSGFRDFRISEDPGFADAVWRTVTAGMTFGFSAGEGKKTLFAQLRDHAGNLADFGPTDFWFDATAPVPVFTVNDTSRYILPGADLFLTIAEEEGDGSPLDRFRVSYDGGASWSEWTAADPGAATEIPHPPDSGLSTLTLSLTDKAGNVSAPAKKGLYLIPSDLPRGAVGLKLSGRLVAREDCAAATIDIVKGNLLTVAAKGKGLTLAVDVVDLKTGETVVEGRYPADARPGTVKAFFTPRTGRYLVVTLVDAASEGDSGEYSLSMKVKAAKANARPDLSTWDRHVPFAAVDGSLFSAKFAAFGLTADAVSIVGPDGKTQAVATGGKPGAVTVSGILAGGTGEYWVEFDRSGLGNPDALISGSASIKLPK